MEYIRQSTFEFLTGKFKYFPRRVGLLTAPHYPFSSALFVRYLQFKTVRAHSSP